MDNIDVRIEQVSNTHLKIHCEPAIAQELSDYFTFTVPSAKFSPSFKAKHWDGKIRLFSLKTKLIYAGLLDHVIDFCTQNGNDYSHSWKTIKSTIPSLPTKAWADSLGIPLEIRDYQYYAYQYAITKQRSIIVSPTASGKSLIIYLISRYLLEHGRKQGLLIVPTISLVEQMYGDFKDYGWDVENNCQRIYQGHLKAPSYPLVISTWQSIYDMPQPYFKQFDFVIGDEAHGFKADSLKTIMTNLINCDYRIGTTGTLDDSKVHKLVLEGLFGTVKKIIDTKTLMEREQIANLDIKCLVLKYGEEDCNRIKGADYADEISFLIGHPRRNRFITNLATGCEGNTLVLYTYVGKHGQILYDMLKEQHGENRKVFFVHGGTDVEDRENIRAITEKENDAIIVASYGTFSTGINIKNLHNVVLASPTKSKIRTLQSIGRSLRLGDNKSHATLYDIADDMRYKTYENHTLSHYEKRVEYYNAERFPLKIHNIGIS